MHYIAPLGAASPDDPYINGNIALGQQGSRPSSETWNLFFAELLNVLAAAGLVQDAEDNTQIAQAIQMLAGFNINGLAQDAAPDVLTDFLPTYDVSGEDNKKVLLSTILTRFMAAYMTIAADADWDDVLTPGMFTVTGDEYVNAPSEYTVWPGTLWVIGRSTNANHKTQMFFYSAATPAIWTRTTTDAGATWSGWVRLLDTRVKHALLTHELSSGTSLAAYTAGAWRTVTLNTENNDDDGIVSLASNQFTLQPGIYRITAMAMSAGSSGSRNRQKIRNVTDGTDALIGINTDIVTNASGTAVTGIVAITSAKTFELQVWPVATTAVNTPITTGEAERYAFVLIEKVG